MERTKEERMATKQAGVSIALIVCVIVLLFVLFGLTGCKSIHEIKTTITKDHIRNITITETIYRDDTSFSLGTVGTGTYQIFSVNGVGL